jgi:hypothetical protein
MLSYLIRRAVTGAVIAGVAAAASYLYRRMLDDYRRQNRPRQRDAIDVSRWEDEGGSPPDLTAAAPHHEVAVR